MLVGVLSRILDRLAYLTLMLILLLVYFHKFNELLII